MSLSAPAIAVAGARRTSGVARGIMFMIAACFFFSVMDVLIKAMTVRYGTMQIVFFRSLFALLPLSVLILRNGGLKVLKTRRPLGHVLRGTLGCAALVCFFVAFRDMPLVDAYAIIFTGPLFLTALAGPMLGERVGPRLWMAVGVGFLGVLVMLRPGSGLWSPAAVLCLIGALLYAFNLIVVRRLGRTEGTTTIVFYFTLSSVAMGGLGMLPDWVWPHDLGDWLALTAIGVTGGIAQLFITQSFRIAPAGVVASFEYTSMIWAVLFGWMVFGDLPSAPVVVGALVVIASGLYILYEETRHMRQPPRPKELP